MTERRIALYEDDCWRNFQPLTLLRPVFELCCGHGCLRERLQRQLPPALWGAFVRETLANAYREEHTDFAVNDSDWLRQSATLVVNGRWLGDPDALVQLEEDAVGTVDGCVVALTVQPGEVDALQPGSWDAGLQHLAQSRQSVSLDGTLLHYPWDLVDSNRGCLVADFEARVTRPTKADINPQTAIIGNDADIFIHPTAAVDPFVVIDARSGPVWIDEQVQVQAFTRIEGPCFIGARSQLFRANIKAGTTIGPECRIGGEIEECIFHGFSNKYHDGFLGHGYICPWVNLGALTTNSDLKNDYSAVKVMIGNDSVDTGSRKVGCFIGEHVKTAIGSFLNTGTSIGAMSLVLPSGELLPKFIPPFSRIWHGELQTLDERGLAAAISTARVAMSRRGLELTEITEQTLLHAYQSTASERSAALERAALRRTH